MPKSNTGVLLTRKSNVSKRAKPKVPKKKKLIRPEWDSTSSDLSAFKLSRNEVVKRHKVHQSKNIEAARHDLYEKAKESYDLDSSGNLRPSPSVTKSKTLLALQQSLHDRQLHEALAKSDRTMRTVKDLFGDEPKRYTCHPNVTIAPHVREDKQILERAISESLEDGPNPTALASPGGIRDRSVRDLVPRKLALNEKPDSKSDDGEGEETGSLNPTVTTALADSDGVLPSESLPYKSVLDLHRFKKVLREQKQERDPEAIVLALPPRHGKKSKGGGKVKRDSRQASSRPVSRHRQQKQQPGVATGGPTLDSSFISGVSEISSIPVDPEGVQADRTVDSEVSSISYNQQSKAAAATQQQVVERGPQPGAHSLQSAVPRSDNQHHRQSHQHPLHVSQKVPSQHPVGPPVGGGGAAEDLRRADDSLFEITGRVHDDLFKLEKLVQDLERELITYERSTSEPDVNHAPSSGMPHPHGTSGTGGGGGGGGSLFKFMGSLLSSAKQMMQYLRQSETQLKGEVAIRNQFLCTLHEQQDLMDAITSDLLRVRSENLALRDELAALRQNTSREIADIKEALAAARIPNLHPPPPRPLPISTGIPSSASYGINTPTTAPSHIDTSSIYRPPPLLLQEGSDIMTPIKTATPLSTKPSSEDQGKMPVPPKDGSRMLTEPKQDVSKEGQGVVFAQVSPLSYGSWSRVDSFASQGSSAPQPPHHHQFSSSASNFIMPLPGEVVHSTGAAGGGGGGNQLLSLADPPPQTHSNSLRQSERFLEMLQAPAPPPLSVALQIPGNNSAFVAHTSTSGGGRHQTGHYHLSGSKLSPTIEITPEQDSETELQSQQISSATHNLMTFPQHSSQMSQETASRASLWSSEGGSHLVSQQPQVGSHQVSRQSSQSNRHVTWQSSQSNDEQSSLEQGSGGSSSQIWQQSSQSNPQQSSQGSSSQVSQQSSRESNRHQTSQESSSQQASSGQVSQQSSQESSGQQSYQGNSDQVSQQTSQESNRQQSSQGGSSFQESSQVSEQSSQGGNSQVFQQSSLESNRGGVPLVSDSQVSQQSSQEGNQQVYQHGSSSQVSQQSSQVNNSQQQSSSQVPQQSSQVNNSQQQSSSQVPQQSSLESNYWTSPSVLQVPQVLPRTSLETHSTSQGSLSASSAGLQPALTLPQNTAHGNPSASLQPPANFRAPTVAAHLTAHGNPPVSLQPPANFRAPNQTPSQPTPQPQPVLLPSQDPREVVRSVPNDSSISTVDLRPEMTRFNAQGIQKQVPSSSFAPHTAGEVVRSIPSDSSISTVDLQPEMTQFNVQGTQKQGSSSSSYAPQTASSFSHSNSSNFPPSKPPFQPRSSLLQSVLHPASSASGKLIESMSDLTQVTDLSTTSQEGGVYCSEGGDGMKDFDSMLDVGKLLESLQQLGKTQDQLQTSADKLRSMPVGKDQSVSPQSSSKSASGAVRPAAFASTGPGGAGPSLYADTKPQQNAAFGSSNPEDAKLYTTTKPQQNAGFASTGPGGAGPSSLHADTKPQHAASFASTDPGPSLYSDRNGTKTAAFASTGPQGAGPTSLYAESSGTSPQQTASTGPGGAGALLNAQQTTAFASAGPEDTGEPSSSQQATALHPPLAPTSVSSVPPSTNQPVRVSTSTSGPSTSAAAESEHIFDQLLAERRLSAGGGKGEGRLSAGGGKGEGRRGGGDDTWFALSSHLL